MSEDSPAVQAARAEAARRHAAYVRLSRWLPLLALLAVLPLAAGTFFDLALPRPLLRTLAIMVLAAVAGVAGLMVWRFQASRRLVAALREQRLARLQGDLNQSVTQGKTTRS